MLTVFQAWPARALGAAAVAVAVVGPGCRDEAGGCDSAPESPVAVVVLKPTPGPAETLLENASMSVTTREDQFGPLTSSDPEVVHQSQPSRVYEGKRTYYLLAERTGTVTLRARARSSGDVWSAVVDVPCHLH